ncbi:MAG: glycosyltransferase, partial [Patescibacteria group bacterium]|nr:glycosyltransferase [Patescibacteria group bacterium]
NPDPRIVDVMYAGRMLSHKHLDVLVQAILILKKKLPNIRCLIIGDGPHRPILEEMIRRLHLRKNITMEPFYSSIDRVYARMKSAKVFALPSSREGFGIAAIEANAAGIPFVTTNDPHNNAQYLFYGRSGKAVDLSPKSFATAIYKYLQNPSDSLTRDCIRNAKRYDWDAAVLATEQTYRLCVN